MLRRSQRKVIFKGIAIDSSPGPAFEYETIFSWPKISPHCSQLISQYISLVAIYFIFHIYSNPLKKEEEETCTCELGTRLSAEPAATATYSGGVGTGRNGEVSPATTPFASELTGEMVRKLRIHFT